MKVSRRRERVENVNMHEEEGGEKKYRTEKVMRSPEDEM